MQQLCILPHESWWVLQLRSEHWQKSCDPHDQICVLSACKWAPPPSPKFRKIACEYPWRPFPHENLLIIFKCKILVSIFSNYCQPPGDTPTRKSFFDGIIAGCIPVIFNKQVTYPFNELFRYDTFTVFVDENNFLNNNHTHIVNDILDKIPDSEIIRMQGNLASVARFMQYGSYGYGDDAFTTALRLLLHVST